MWKYFRKLTNVGSKIGWKQGLGTVCVAGSIMTTASTNVKTKHMINGNQILNDKHRVALAGWPVHQDKGGNKEDIRTNTLTGLVNHLSDCGYDGIEMAFTHFQKMYFEHSKLSISEQIDIIKSKLNENNLQIFGYLTCSKDTDWINDESISKHLETVKTDMINNKRLGAEYVIFHMFLPKQYMNSDGCYRNNEQLLNKYVDRIRTLQQIAYDVGLNFYVETHVWMCSEDPEAFSKIIDLYNGKYGNENINCFEVNGDLAHYICRGMMNGPFVDNILSSMEHTHVRMARVYGDVSVDVFNPIDDWNNKGVTWKYWQFAKKGLKNGLTSRVIVGESGPYHLVKDPLTQDQRMMPLLRAMAQYCDSQVGLNEYNEQSNPFVTQS
eukprot:354362_1